MRGLEAFSLRECLEWGNAAYLSLDAFRARIKGSMRRPYHSTRLDPGHLTIPRICSQPALLGVHPRVQTQIIYKQVWKYVSNPESLYHYPYIPNYYS
jgi:hypothetical protein